MKNTDTKIIRNKKEARTKENKSEKEKHKARKVM
jgi:hypothetical protein